MLYWTICVWLVLREGRLRPREGRKRDVDVTCTYTILYVTRMWLDRSCC